MQLFMPIFTQNVQYQSWTLDEFFQHLMMMIIEFPLLTTMCRLAHLAKYYPCQVLSDDICVTHDPLARFDQAPCTVIVTTGKT